MPDSKAVRRMFASIAGRYDLANCVMSAGMHRHWERELMRNLLTFLPSGRREHVLDLCTGTGALLPNLRSCFNQVVGADFCGPMLALARRNAGSHCGLVQGDAHALPFPAHSFDAVVIAYGVRNFENLQRALGEIRRVLRPGGRLAILEFGGNDSPLNWATRLYTKTVVPVLGGIITGDFDAYRYLNDSSSCFPAGPDFVRILEGAGLAPLFTRSMFGGANVYIAQRK